MGVIKRISLIGMGAIGCAFGRKLYDVNPGALKVIANKERIARYIKKGFIIDGKEYNFSYIEPEEKCEPADLVIIAVKSNGLTKAIEDIKNHVGKDTIIISLLNGITSEEIIGKQYGMEKMLYSLCIAEANRSENKIHISNHCSIVFGEKTNKEYSDKVKMVKELFDRANISYEIPEDMMHSLWWKFMVNVGVNQSSAVIRGTYGTFKQKIEAKNLMESAMLEVVTLSEKVGVNLNKGDINKWYELLDTLEPNGRTSMCQDILNGRKTEVDIFAGTVCKLGKKYGIETPINRTLLDIIKVIE
ncbi:ketopantoate reductase [Clostridium acidisoli DSM 12555]|uniref:2-dehydropantoate 2-reductase n=1 Tax=Clostridium acidisoli DSM 12555 TaxID=1121291 RepID=A0A1W1XBP0_9CLOT|nr:ketopantoate reductase family protein [Clostridium acidisoli]SMC21283.1 ketopantoate reductase [Clostridium acidisoli DSM 12555]